MSLIAVPVTVAADDTSAPVRFTTEAALTRSCEFRATVSDDSVKDLRKKVARAGGDTALLSFKEESTIQARVFRCPSGNAAVVAAPAAAPAPPAKSLSGTFSGAVSANSKGRQWTTEVVFTLVQAGADVTGLWNTTGGTSGGVTGVLAESGIPSLKIRQVKPCAGDFAGLAVVESGGNRLRGSYVGNDCNGQVTGSFVVDRNPPPSAPPSSQVATSTPATAGNRATAEWEYQRDVQALMSNSFYATHGPLWWNLWQKNEAEKKISDKRDSLLDYCLRAKGF
jgi:hypothetical protein